MPRTDRCVGVPFRCLLLATTWHWLHPRSSDISRPSCSMAAVIEAPNFSRDRFFYTGMALLAAFTVVLGFSPTFYMRGALLPPLPRRPGRKPRVPLTDLLPALTFHVMNFYAW